MIKLTVIKITKYLMGLSIDCHNYNITKKQYKSRRFYSRDVKLAYLVQVGLVDVCHKALDLACGINPGVDIICNAN